MKKIVCIALSVIFVFALSVPAFAAAGDELPKFPDTQILDGSHNIRTFITSTLTDEKKEFMRGFAYDTHDRQMVLFKRQNHVTEGYLDSIYFVKVNTSANLLFSGVYANYPCSFKIQGDYPFCDYVTFIKKRDETEWKETNTGITKSAKMVQFNSVLSAKNVNVDLSSSPLSKYYWQHSSNWGWTDDNGLIDNPEEPDPDPNPTLPDLPTIGKIDHDLVPYDTTIWNVFISKIKGDIGSIVNIGLVILTYLMSIFIVIKIVKQFT